MWGYGGQGDVLKSSLFFLAQPVTLDICAAEAGGCQIQGRSGIQSMFKDNILIFYLKIMTMIMLTTKIIMTEAWRCGSLLETLAP